MIGRESEQSLSSDKRVRDSMIVVEVPREDAAQMARVDDHEVIQTFATNRTDHPLDISVLPRCAGRSDHFRDAQRFDPLAEFNAVGGVTIAADNAAPCPMGTLR
jgi:hypothetical protein